jgi:hypothetical protein
MAPVANCDLHDTQRWTFPKGRATADELPPPQDRIGRSPALLAAFSPDFKIAEKAFSRLNAMLRKIGERAVSGLWNLIGQVVDIF